MQDNEWSPSQTLILHPGDGVTIIVDTETYRGTLFVENGRWCVKVLGAVPDGVQEVVIVKL